MPSNPAQRASETTPEPHCLCGGGGPAHEVGCPYYASAPRVPEETLRRQRFHELKTWRMYFDDVLSCRKTFEYRKDDRSPRFEVGDVLHLREWGGREDAYTGRECMRIVTYIARGGPIIPEGHCIMAMEVYLG